MARAYGAVAGNAPWLAFADLEATDYEVTTASLLLIQSLIAAYAAVVNSPRAATVKIGTAKEATEAMNAVQREIFDQQLDKLVKPITKTNPAFYSDYTKSRIIVDKAATHAAKTTPVPPAGGGK